MLYVIVGMYLVLQGSDGGEKRANMEIAIERVIQVR